MFENSDLPDDFDSALYLDINPDVRDAGVDPEWHYIQFGRNEGITYKKIGIVDALSQLFDQIYDLEFCTTSTGLNFADIRTYHSKEIKRRMHLAPSSFNDSLRMNCRSPDEPIDCALGKFEKYGSLVDIILVDGLHTYSTASHDRGAMYELLKDGGILAEGVGLAPNSLGGDLSRRARSCGECAI